MYDIDKRNKFCYRCLQLSDYANRVKKEHYYSSSPYTSGSDALFFYTESNSAYR
ncbi:MAG: hypothetical protein US11_C0006G0016 [Candidatus Roizmanbacteria bacterium GW2011_GWA2_36_23]|uniref:Uncharacterized protein n=1 Tax=Candidatus Roizmanbacteria bacterium GW2011_GWA2_36_23 TaxID=1618480 RepID=A0A0G0GP30_9BACT|nr:MAG: hypothetical protein US11_C0006G0016 [Candidatus Roizmanbacteria bacterium GW2011_GWA2_36_23]